MFACFAKKQEIESDVGGDEKKRRNGGKRKNARTIYQRGCGASSENSESFIKKSGKRKHAGKGWKRKNEPGGANYVSPDLIRSEANKAAALTRSVASELQQLAV